MKLSEMTLEQRIAFEAIVFDQLRLKAQHLKRQRTTFRCTREGLEELTGVPASACWRYWAIRTQSEWCEPCRQRQAVHDEYQRTNAKRGARLRVLHRLCALAGGWQVAPTIQLISEALGA